MASERKSPDTYDALCVTLPAFAITVLRQRAIDGDKDVSEVLTRLVLDDIMVDEVQEMAARNPGLGESFGERRSGGDRRAGLLQRERLETPSPGGRGSLRRAPRRDRVVDVRSAARRGEGLPVHLSPDVCFENGSTGYGRADEGERGDPSPRPLR